MKYIPFEARCVFIDGPVAIYVHDADPDEIYEAYVRLGHLVMVRTHQLREERANDKSTRPER